MKTLPYLLKKLKLFFLKMFWTCLGYNGYLGRSTMVVCKPKVSYVGNNFETLTYESLNDDLYRDYNSQVTGLEKVKNPV